MSQIAESVKMNCPKCNKLVVGDLRSFCKSCLFSFDNSGDRWFDFDDEEISVSELRE